jgi:hypothetical protein
VLEAGRGWPARVLRVSRWGSRYISLRWNLGLAEWELGGQHYTDAITNTPEFRPSHSDYLKWYSIEQPAEPGQRVTFTSTLDYGYAKSEQYICTIIGRDRHGVPHSLKVADPGPKPVCKVEARVPANW